MAGRAAQEVSLLRATIELAIDLTRDLPGLAAFWRAHQHALRLLSPEDLAQVVALKDHRKRLLQSTSTPPAMPRHQPRLV